MDKEWRHKPGRFRRRKVHIPRSAAPPPGSESQQPRRTNPMLHRKPAERLQPIRGDHHDPCYTSPKRKPIRRNARGRCPNGAMAYREIQELQDSTHLLVPNAPMKRLVQEITHREGKRVSKTGNDDQIRVILQADFRMPQAACDPIHTIAESYIIDFLSAADACANHAKRKTVTMKDVNFASSLYHKDLLL